MRENSMSGSALGADKVKGVSMRTRLLIEVEGRKLQSLVRTLTIICYDKC